MSHWEEFGKSDEYYTPFYIFDALGCKFNLDVAAPVDRTHVCVPADRFITENSLEMDWTGFIWMNPPFGKRNSLKPWLDKIHQQGNGIALTPDRTSATWWQDAAKQADKLLLVHGKIKFIRQDGTTAKSPSTGTTLFAYGDRACFALRNAEAKGLGLVLKLK